MKTTIGGDRLGSGNKQNVSLKNYSRSTHDLSYLWRSSMSAGTLVPFMSEVGLPGDSFDIDLNCDVKTLPTAGPLFGSYKVQLDVFSVPVRLYNGKLHMNKLGIGMDMSSIKLPQVRLEAFWNPDVAITDNAQVNSSCIFSYLNIRGLGKGTSKGIVRREFNAIPYLGYWDIYKNYYANKQEERGVMIHIAPGEAVDYIVGDAWIEGVNSGNRTQVVSIPDNSYLNVVKYEVTLQDGVGSPNWDEVQIEIMSGVMQGLYFLDDLYGEFTISGNGLIGTWQTWVATDPDWGDTRHSNRIAQGQFISSSVAPSTDKTPQLAEFDLENIDKAREDILVNTRSADAWTITKASDAPYGSPLLTNDVDELAALEYTQEGLAVKTYQSDLFNNWISTEWIDGANGINEITAVDTTGDSFSIDSLNLASKVYKMLNRIAISGGTYDDWLDAVYTHERSRSVENPVYCGSLIKELSFEEVVSTADASLSGGGEVEGQALGTLAGRGRLTGKNKGGKIKVKIDEPSVIMGIVSLTPRIDYSQGNKWDVNLKTMNDFHKPALDAIGYQDLITDQMAWFDTGVSNDWTAEPDFNSAGKQPAWINYMTNVNQVRGSFADKNDSMFMTLNRRYEGSAAEGITDLTTYIDPSKFNHIFADTRLDAMNFWVQISNNITARRKMSAKVIPNL